MTLREQKAAEIIRRRLVKSTYDDTHAMLLEAMQWQAELCGDVHYEKEDSGSYSYIINDSIRNAGIEEVK